MTARQLFPQTRRRTHLSQAILSCKRQQNKCTKAGFDVKKIGVQKVFIKMSCFFLEPISITQINQIAAAMAPIADRHRHWEWQKTHRRDCSLTISIIQRPCRHLTDYLHLNDIFPGFLLKSCVKLSLPKPSEERNVHGSQRYNVQQGMCLNESVKHSRELTLCHKNETASTTAQ